MACVPPVNNTTQLSSLCKLGMAYTEYHGYASVLVCIFGLIANMANVIVLTRKNMISSTNCILTWLAVADLLTMASYFFFALHFYIMRDPEIPALTTRSYGWCVMLLIHASFTIVCHTIAIWLTIVLAIFRYLYICFPTKGSILCSISRAKLSIFLVYLCTIGICVPNYLVNYINSTETPEQFSTGNGSVTINTTIYEVKVDDEGKPLVYTANSWLQAILFKIIPCAMLTILTCLLIHAMHQAHKRRMKLKSQGRKDESDKHGEHNRTTGMLLAIVVLFLITELPQGILTLLSIFIPNFYYDVYIPLGDILDIMALINNAINFVLYCTMSRQFRDTFVNVFCGCCSEHRPGWLKMKAVTAQNGSHTTSSRV